MIGIDTVHIPRIERAVKSAAFKERVFTENERNYCESRPHPAASFAGIFCAKEAAVKALKRGFGSGIMPCDIEIDHDKRGTPVFKACGKAAILLSSFSVDVSISHDGEYAVAVVMLSDRITD